MKKNKHKKIFRNNLDEMQEQKLLHIEAHGFWILYVLIACDLLIGVLTGSQSKGNENLIEFCSFLAVSIYLTGSCIKNGIWDRHLQATVKTNVILSVIAGLIVAAVNAVVYLRNISGSVSWQKLAGIGGISALFTMLLTLLFLCIGTAFYQRRTHVLEDGPEESEDEK